MFKELKRLAPMWLRPWWLRDYFRALPGRRTERLCDNTVQGGPFKGTRYGHTSVGSTFPPKLLGIYEMELRPAVEELIAWKPDGIINIGAAEGYYAIGLARRTACAVVAFEAEQEGRDLIGKMAAANGVADRVEICGFCKPADLKPLLTRFSKCALVVDCEGGEFDLLDPGSMPQLQRSMILVELHDFADPRITPTLRKRFESTHEIRTFSSTDRHFGDLPEGIPLHSRLMMRIWWKPYSWEGRGDVMHWFLMVPKPA